jgi:hypothetical protein
LPNDLDNACKIRHHLFVGETQNLEALRFKEGVASLVGVAPFFEIMRLAVKLHDQFGRVAYKVGDVVSDRNLSAKAKTIDPIGLQIAPQQRFGTRHGLAKLLCSLALTITDNHVRHSRLPPSLALPHKGGGNGRHPA